MSQYYQSTVSQLLHDSLIKLCQESVPFAHQLEVDGIICISPGDESNQIVVKVHEILNHLKPNIIVHLPPEETKAKVRNNELKDDGEKCASEISEKKEASGSDSVMDLGVTPMEKTVSDSDCMPSSDMKLNHSIRSLLSPVSKVKLDCSPTSSRRKGRKSASPCAIRNEVMDVSMDSEDEPCLLVNLPSQEIIPMSKKRSPQTSPRTDHSYTNHPKPSQTFQDKLDQLAKASLSKNGDVSQASDQKQSSSDENVPMDCETPNNIDSVVGCKYCGGEKYYDFNALFEHNLVKHKKYTCKYCYNTFTMRCNLRRHEQLHSGIKPYRCVSCGRGFTRNNDLKIHETKHGCPSAPWWSECKACGLTFSRKRLFREHWCIGSMARPGQTSGGSIVYQENLSTSGQSSRSPAHASPPISEHYEQFHATFDETLPAAQPSFSKFTFDQSNKAAWHFIQSEREAFQKQQNQDKILIKVECPTLTPNCDFEGILQPSAPSASKSTKPQFDKASSRVVDVSKSNKLSEKVSVKMERISPMSETDHLASELVSALVGLSNTTAKYTVNEQTDISTTGSTSPAVSSLILQVPSNQPKISYPIPNGILEAGPQGSSKKSPQVKHKRSTRVLKEEDQSTVLPISDFTCPICKVTMDNFPEYDSHCESLHRRFACQICGLTFSNRNNRARHVRTHTGERDFMCTECGKGFTRSDTLREHQIIHTDGYIVSKCDYCGMELEKKSELLAHIKRCLWYHKRAGKMAAQLQPMPQLHSASQVPVIDQSNEATWLFIQSEREAFKKQLSQDKEQVNNEKKAGVSIVSGCENGEKLNSERSTSNEQKDDKVEEKI